MSSMKEIFAKNLQLLLKEAKINARKLSEDLQISSGRMSLWVQGKNMPSVENLVKIADYFAVSLDYLVGRIDY